MINIFTKKISVVPVAFSGLSLATIGITLLLNLFLSNTLITSIGLIISVTLLTIFIIRSVFNISLLKSEIKHPVTGSFYATVSMAIMLYSVALKDYAYNFAIMVWVLGGILHTILLITFIVYRFIEKDFNKVVPSWVIPTIGFNILILSGVNFTNASFLAYILYFEYILSALTIGLILYYVLFNFALKNDVMPTFGTMAAPFNLILLTVLAFYQTNANILALQFLSVAGIATSCLVYFSIIKLVQLPFSPLFTAYTFPLVLAATATVQYSNFLKYNELRGAVLYYNIGIIQTIIVLTIFTIVFIKLIKLTIKKAMTA